MSTIKFEIEVEDKELDYILAGCFEGGSNYWIGKRVTPKNNNYKGAEFASEVISKGGILLIHEEEENKTHELTKAMLLKGIKQYASKNNGIDFEQLDAGCYDNILQYALFNEVKYG